MIYILIILLIYIIGCLLALFRLYACLCSVKYLKGSLQDNAFKEFFVDVELRGMVFFSWVAFGVAVLMYFEENDEYFLKIYK